jgi:hypothetical protein
MKVGALVSFCGYIGIIVSTEEYETWGDILVLWSSGNTQSNICADLVEVLS